MSDGSAVKYLFIALGTTIAIGSAVVVIGNNNTITFLHPQDKNQQTPKKNDTPQDQQNKLYAPSTNDVINAPGQSTIPTNDEKTILAPSPNKIEITTPIIVK